MPNDEGTHNGERRALSDPESGLCESPQLLHSWSSYLCRSQIQFRAPEYGEKSCQAPILHQIEFSGGGNIASREGQWPHVSPAGQLPANGRLNAARSSIMKTAEHITPGILRPEEHQNSLGRCHHHDNRYHNVLGELNMNPSRNDSTATGSTLVGSPLSQKPYTEFEMDTRRHSMSSRSSYSSQMSESDAPVSTRRLLRYYLDPGGDPDNGVESSRWNRDPDMPNSCSPNGFQDDSMHPLQAHPIEQPGHGALPPPYRPSNQKPRPSLQEHFKPRYIVEAKSKKLERRPRPSREAIERDVYILQLCKAFLLFGIQAHRLEEYLQITARCLNVTAEFQYFPHCMLVVLTNPEVQANEVHLLKESTSVDLAKLEDVYQVYEAVVEDNQDLQFSIRQLDNITRRRKTYSNQVLILLHGPAALCAGTFAFSARPIDFGPLFVFGCLLAVLQLLVLRTPIRNSHILEVLTCIIIAFSARGLGSISVGDTPLFCFSGITQGTVALILPGHIILAAVHEIQNRCVLSGSIKMIYAILYTLFLGFGILVGASIYGFIDSSATIQTTCEMPWYWKTSSHRWRVIYSQFVWVPIFAAAISVMHQAKKKHLPAMVVIATCGHQAFYWSLARFAQNLQFAGMIAAFVNGLLANIYAALVDSLAATILLPAVLVIIPNALAASGSLVAGVDTANAIVTAQSFHMNGSLFHTGFQRRDFSAEGSSGSTGRIITAGFGMAQATIGITVGLFLSAFVVWPFTRHRAGFLAF